MHTHADKTQENKNQSVSNVESNKQSSAEPIFQFIDNRPEAVAQRKLQEMANDSLQAKQTAQLKTITHKHTTQQQHPIQKKENNTGLPDNLKTGIENLSGLSLDDVKVHKNSDKPAQIQAHAYAQGTDIHLGPGQEKHLPHEAWHVVQQKQGRVKPTRQMKGIGINDDTELEKEADVMGEKALKQSSGKDIILKKQKTTSETFQRFYAASELMRFKEVIDESIEDQDNSSVSSEKQKSNPKAVFLSDSFTGPWKQCTDTTSKGYREAANTALGSNVSINALERHKVIMAPDSSRFAYSLSHLISAEFGGQLKYTDPKDNIRFFPEQLEYGWWQKAESTVKNVGDVGRLQVLGSDGSVTLKFQMAKDLVSMVSHLFTHKQLVDMEIALYDILSGVKYVPVDVSFSYKDYGNGQDVIKTEEGLNKGLQINKSAPLENVLRVLSEFKILPEIDKTGQELTVETTSSNVIKKEDLPKFISQMASGSKRAATMIDAINRVLDRVKDGVGILNESIEDQINKWPEVKKANLKITIVVAPDDFSHISR